MSVCDALPSIYLLQLLQQAARSARLADMVAFNWNYKGGIERGERNVALVNIEKIAITLRVFILELFRGV